MSPDCLILGFDTAAAHCAAALLSGSRPVAARSEPMARGQAERLMPLIEEMLAEAGCGWRDLDALAVGIGPGNFTGIRISVAAARGLALSLGIPARGASGFEALRVIAGRPVIACLPAPRDAVYLQAMHEPPGPPRLLALADLAGADLPADLRADLPCAGPAAASVAALLGRAVATEDAPSPGAIALAALAQGDAPATRPMPLYIPPADAAPRRDAAPVLLP